MDYVENPGWVDKILSDNWSAIERTIPQEWLPVVATKGRTRKTFEEFGCGHYGCVMPTGDESVVFKVTSDESEAAFVVAVKTLGVEPQGLVKYKSIYEIPQATRLRRRVFLIVRDSADEVGGFSNIGHDASSYTRRSVGLAIDRLLEFKVYAAKARDTLKAQASIPSTVTQASVY